MSQSTSPPVSFEVSRAIYNHAVDTITDKSINAWITRCFNNRELPRIEGHTGGAPEVTRLGGRPFMLTKKARALVEQARRGERFTFSEKDLAAIAVRGTTPKLKGRRIILTEEQLAETIAGRSLHELKDQQITYEDPQPAPQTTGHLITL